MTVLIKSSLLRGIGGGALVMIKYGIMALPGTFLWLDWGFHEEDGTSLIFPPGYDPFFLALMATHLLAYFYCTHRRRAGHPNLELFLNLLLVAGIVQNLLMAIRIDFMNRFQLCFALPILLLAFAIVRNCYRLSENHKY